MTLPKANKDWFINLASFNLSAVAPVFFTRSLPAKSTRYKSDVVIILSVACFTFFTFVFVIILIERSILSINIAWDRLECSFIFVLAVARYFSPIWNNSLHCDGVVHFILWTPSKYTPFSGSSLIFMSFNSGSNKSWILSKYNWINDT